MSSARSLCLRSSLVLVAFTAISLASSGMAAASSPTFGPSAQLSSLKTYGCGLSTAVGSDGTGVVAFTGSSVFGPAAHVYVRRLAPTAASFGPLMDLHSGRNACGVSSAVASDGTVAVGWSRLVGKTRYVEAAVARPGKAFGTVKLVQSGGSNNFISRLKMLSTPTGFVFTWRLHVGGSSPDQIRYATSGVSGSFSTWRILTSRVGQSVSAVEAGNDGTLLAFSSPGQPAPPAVRNWLLETVHLAPGGTAFSAPVPLATSAAVSDAYAETTLKDLHRGPGGVGATSMEYIPSEIGFGLVRHYKYTTLASGSAFAQLAEVSTSYPSYSGDGEVWQATDGPVIAMPSGGKPVLGWTEGIDVVGDNDVVINRRMKIAVGLGDGSVTTPVEVAGLGSFAKTPTAASLGSLGIIAWEEASRSHMRPLVYTLVSQDGTASSKATLGTSDMRGSITIASGLSRAIAVWVSGNRVQASIIRN
ncbi:MAG: hypothetical protein NTY57_02965 [Solirubrobacterales bacterium]|nr:hypothetical protein [Solirubrobacterales bacterium]